MSFEMETTGDLSSESNFLKVPGTYHFAVTHVLEGQGPKGGIIDGFTVGLDVLAGTAPGQEGKTINMTLFRPRLDQTDKAKKMSIQKQTAFVVAANVVDPTKLGQRVTVDLQAAVGQQIVAKFAVDDRENSEGYLQLNYADIWHVDDPACEAVPKRADAIAMIPKEFRHNKEWFVQVRKPKDQGNGSGNGSKDGAKTAGRSAAGDNFDNL